MGWTKGTGPSAADRLLRVMGTAPAQLQQGTFHLLPTLGTALNPERNQLKGDRGQALARAPRELGPLCPLWSDSRGTNTCPCCHAIGEVPDDPPSTLDTKVKRTAMTCRSLGMEQGKQYGSLDIPAMLQTSTSCLRAVLVWSNPFQLQA